MQTMDIGIAEKDRARIVSGLERLLADTYVLYFKTHAFHWNVQGPMFDTLHKLFEQQYTELWKAIDELAERVRVLGAPAPGSGAKIAELTSIEDADGVPEAKEMISQLLHGHEAVIRTARDALARADKAHDQGTVDLITRRLEVHEKTAWMLRSLLA